MLPIVLTHKVHYTGRCWIQIMMLSVYLVAIICVNCAIAASEPEYKTIDEYLEKYVETKDPVANMRAAIDWLNSSPDESVENALYEFTSMSRIQSENWCSKTSHDILLWNDQATGGRAHLGKHTRSRVEEIVNHFCTEHATYCRQVYPINFVKKYRLINRGYIRELETFINEGLINTLFGMRERPLADNSELFDRSISNTDTLINSAFKSIKVLAQADIANDYKTFKHLFRRYIVVPCNEFAQALGPDVFLPATFDASWNQRVEGDDVEFYIALARFKICNHVIENEANLVEALENLSNRI